MELDAKTEEIVDVMHPSTSAGAVLESVQLDGDRLLDYDGPSGILEPRGNGGSATTGNAGSANGGSVIISGGNITNVNGSANGGNGGISSSGSAIGGDAGPDTGSAPQPEPAPPADTPSQPPVNTPSSLPSVAPSSPSAPPPNTTRPAPRPSHSQAPPASNSIPDSISSSADVPHSDSILTGTETTVTSPTSGVPASEIHHTTTSVTPPASQSGDAMGRGPSHSLLLKILLPILGTILLVALATGFIIRRRRRRSLLAETPTPYYALHAGSASANLNGSNATLHSRHSSNSKRRLLEAMTQKGPTLAGSAADPAISRASSSASGTGATSSDPAVLLDAMRHAGLPVSVVAVLQPAAGNRQHDLDSEMPPSYHRGEVNLEAGSSSEMARAP